MIGVIIEKEPYWVPVYVTICCVFTYQAHLPNYWGSVLPWTITISLWPIILLNLIATACAL